MPYRQFNAFDLPIGVEAVESRNFGGFMLSITIGVVAIGCSLPHRHRAGAGAAVGMLLIVKAICVGFIEFIRGVPLITLAVRGLDCC